MAGPETATLELDVGECDLDVVDEDGVFRCDVSRDLFDRVTRVSRRTGMDPGALWDLALDRGYYADARDELDPRTYDTKHEYHAAVIRDTLRIAVGAFGDGSNTPPAVENQHKITEELQ